MITDGFPVLLVAQVSSTRWSNAGSMGGGEGTRTPGLLRAREALYQAELHPRKARKTYHAEDDRLGLSQLTRAVMSSSVGASVRSMTCCSPGPVRSMCVGASSVS
jgi:hypothetical protein